MQLTKRKTALGLLIVLALVLVLFWRFGPDRQVAKVQALRKELFSEAGRTLSPDERRQRFETLRKEEEALTPEQRRAASADGRKRREAEMAGYFKLAPEQKLAFLDERIDRMEQRRLERMAAGNAAANGKGGPPGGRSLAGGGAGPNANGQLANAGTPFFGSMSLQQRDQMRMNMLDSTTPEQRAQFLQFMKDMRDRRAQCGLPPLQGPGGGPPGP